MPSAPFEWFALARSTRDCCAACESAVLPWLRRPAKDVVVLVTDSSCDGYVNIDCYGY